MDRARRALLDPLRRAALEHPDFSRHAPGAVVGRAKERDGALWRS
jgi:hypothetical protein